MLRRHRQLRTQINQVKDAGLFCLALWLAYCLCADMDWSFIGWVPMVGAFRDYVWLYLVIIPGVPLILDSQGFYKRPFIPRRSETIWILFKSCLLAAVGVILLIFLLKMTTLLRSVVIFFGVISFALVFLYEELRRAVYKSKIGRVQFRQRFILIGSREDTSWFYKGKTPAPEQDIDVVAKVGAIHRSVSLSDT